MIYVVEDDEGIRDIELYTLHTTGFEAEGFPDGLTFEKAMQKKKPELVILDIMLPDEDGVQILINMKKDPSMRDIPVIIASARGEEYDKVKALDLGADDYLAKPFGMMEMVSRIKAVLRRTSLAKQPEVIHLDEIELYPERHLVTISGKPAELTVKEFSLLKKLMENAGIVLSRERLLDEIWGIDYDGETRTVDVHIRTLRSKLGEAERHIETVRGIGYRYREN